MIGTQLIRRPVKVFGELTDCHQVRPYGSLRVITTLEFLQHHAMAITGYRCATGSRSTCKALRIPEPSRSSISSMYVAHRLGQIASDCGKSEGASGVSWPVGIAHGLDLLSATGAIHNPK